jgi:Ca-activated chloride channel family protein
MPVKTGNYEIRYYSCSGKEPKVLASSPIRIDRVTVELRAPKSAIGGETINVYWEGPNIEDYFIGIGKRGKIYSNYRNAATGNPSKLLLPLEMGEYEIRFYAGKDQKVLASVPIRVGSVDVILMAPQRALVGETIDVRWQGPDYEGDFIGIGKVEKEYTHFNYTSDGNPSKLEMPDKPGFYEIRYYAGQDNSVLGIVTIHVEDPENA